jgi:diphthine-ammonia ligase
MEFISEEQWKKDIAEIRKNTSNSSKEKLKQAILDAVKRRVPDKRFGIFFSGGIDSTFIAYTCKQLGADFICYSVGIENSTDVEWAKKIAKKLGFKLRYKIYSLEEAEQIISDTVKLFRKNPNIVTIGVGSVFYAASQLAKKDKIAIFFSGLGSEEIFAGYERHAKAKDKHEECWKGLVMMWKRDIERDLAIAKKIGYDIRTPFLDKEVIRQAMGIDISRKISDEQKKIILREIAEELGIPKEFAWRKKQAAQYGSKFDRAIKRLARKHGFEYKKEYLSHLASR